MMKTQYRRGIPAVIASTTSPVLAVVIRVHVDGGFFGTVPAISRKVSLQHGRRNALGYTAQVLAGPF